MKLSKLFKSINEIELLIDYDNKTVLVANCKKIFDTKLKIIKVKHIYYDIHDLDDLDKLGTLKKTYIKIGD